MIYFKSISVCLIWACFFFSLRFPKSLGEENQQRILRFHEKGRKENCFNENYEWRWILDIGNDNVMMMILIAKMIIMLIEVFHVWYLYWTSIVCHHDFVHICFTFDGVIVVTSIIVSIVFFLSSFLFFFYYWLLFFFIFQLMLLLVSTAATNVPANTATFAFTILLLMSKTAGGVWKGSMHPKAVKKKKKKSRFWVQFYFLFVQFCGVCAMKERKKKWARIISIEENSAKWRERVLSVHTLPQSKVLRLLLYCSYCYYFYHSSSNIDFVTGSLAMIKEDSYYNNNNDDDCGSYDTCNNIDAINHTDNVNDDDDTVVIVINYL